MLSDDYVNTDGYVYVEDREGTTHSVYPQTGADYVNHVSVLSNSTGNEYLEVRGALNQVKRTINSIDDPYFWVTADGYANDVEFHDTNAGDNDNVTRVVSSNVSGAKPSSYAILASSTTNRHYSIQSVLSSSGIEMYFRCGDAGKGDFRHATLINAFDFSGQSIGIKDSGVRELSLSDVHGNPVQLILNRRGEALSLRATNKAGNSRTVDAIKIRHASHNAILRLGSKAFEGRTFDLRKVKSD